ncbi:penicillin acylase family protein [Cupriavidus basilensis]
MPRHAPGAEKEVQSLLAWTRQAQAHDWKSWTAQAARQALTINWYYADRQGNIGYVHTGAYPHRRDRARPAPARARYRGMGLARRAAVLHQPAGLQPALGLYRQLEQLA